MHRRGTVVHAENVNVDPGVEATGPEATDFSPLLGVLGFALILTGRASFPLTEATLLHYMAFFVAGVASFSLLIKRGLLDRVRHKRCTNRFACIVRTCWPRPPFHR